MEIAFVSANKLKIFLDKEQGNLTNKIVSKFTEKPNSFIIYAYRVIILCWSYMEFIWPI